MSNIVDVGCAVITKEGKVLIAQRKEDDHLGGYWEFPGGKREEGESLEACLIREAEEELGIQILPKLFLQRVAHISPARELRLHFMLCDWIAGEPVALDCADFRWVVPQELKNFRFPPADDGVIAELIEKQGEYFRS